MQLLFLGALKTHMLNLNWAALLLERAAEGEGKAGSHCVGFCLSPQEFVREKWEQACNPAIESENRREGETAPNLFVLFCFWCLHTLPELVNHIGSPGYHSILTKWYLLNFVCSQNCWALPAEWVLLSSPSPPGDGVRGKTSILSSYILEWECISFLHLMASNISPNSLRLRNTLSFEFSHHFHSFHVLYFFFCAHISIHFR